MIIKHRVDITGGIECGGFHYEVLCDDESRRLLEGTQRLGECLNLHHIIRLHHGYSSLGETFLHECLEAISYIYLDSDIKHTQISGLAQGLYQVLHSLGIEFDVKWGQDGKPYKARAQPESEGSDTPVCAFDGNGTGANEGVGFGEGRCE